MSEVIDQAKDIALLVLASIACFGLSFLGFAIRGDRKKPKQ